MRVMRRWVAPIIVGLLMVYTLMGVVAVPFHGDESTLIYASHDYFYQFVERDLDIITNRAEDVSVMDRRLRQLDGRVQKYANGLAIHLTGRTLADLNEPWRWGESWEANVAQNSIPSDAVLMAARWSCALMLMLAVPAAYGVGGHLGGMVAGLVLAALIATSPNLIVNGRRAMMEAPLLLFTLLSVLAALRWTIARDRRALWIWSAVLALAVGMLLAAKLSALFVVVPLFGGLGLYGLFRRSPLRVLQLGMVTAIALAIFLLMNPAWWPNPVRIAARVFERRTELITNQMASFGQFQSTEEALRTFWRFTFANTPQYYEVDEWGGWVGDQIQAYEATPWVGIWLGHAGGAVLLALTLFGLWTLFTRRTSRGWVFMIYAAGAVVTVLMLTPLAWARYYLPALPAVYGLAAVGTSALAGRITTRFRVSSAD